MRPAATRSLVGVVGGGIGGMAAALACQRLGLDCSVFEADGGFDDRRQGYGITVQQGGTALRRLGVPIEGIAAGHHYAFDSTGRTLGCYGRFRIETATPMAHRLIGSPHLADGTTRTPAQWHGALDPPAGPKAGRHNAHIPRQRLRDLIMREVDDRRIRWG